MGVSGAVRTASKVGEKKEEGRRGRQRASDGKGERQSWTCRAVKESVSLSSEKVAVDVRQSPPFAGSLDKTLQRCSHSIGRPSITLAETSSRRPCDAKRDDVCTLFLFLSLFFFFFFVVFFATACSYLNSHVSFASFPPPCFALLFSTAAVVRQLSFLFSSGRCLALIWINLINHTVCLDCTPIRLLLMPWSAVIESARMCVGFTLFLISVLSYCACCTPHCSSVKHVPANQAVHNLATVTKTSVRNCTAFAPLWQLPPSQPVCHHSLANICGSLLLLSLSLFLLFHPLVNDTIPEHRFRFILINSYISFYSNAFCAFHFANELTVNA